jgi:hypothetical protein
MIRVRFLLIFGIEVIAITIAIADVVPLLKKYKNRS